MKGRISFVLTAVFILAFAFSLAVSVHTPAEAIPGCCHIRNVCPDGTVYTGWCPRIDDVCRCDLYVPGLCPGYPPADCDIP